MENFNAAILKKFSIVYVTRDELIDNKSEMIKSIFDKVLVVQEYKIFLNHLRQTLEKVDLILFEKNILDEDDKNLLKQIRLINKKIPIVWITNEITKSTLEINLNFNLTRNLLRPVRIQELAKTAFYTIQKYHREVNMKNSLKLLSLNMEPLLKDNKKLKKNIAYYEEKINFYESLHNDFLNSFKIDKTGKVISTSAGIKKLAVIDLIGIDISKLFKNPSKIQKALLFSLKSKSLVSENDFILYEKEQIEKRITIMPHFQNNYDDDYCFYIFLNRGV